MTIRYARDSLFRPRRLAAIAGLIAVSAAARTAAAKSAPVRIVNGSFETVAPSGLPTGWHVSEFGEGAKVEISNDAHHGSKALRLVDSSPPDANKRRPWRVSQRLRAKPGYGYRARVRVKCVAKTGPRAVLLQLSFRPGRMRVLAPLEARVGEGYREFQVRAEAPRGAKFVQLELLCLPGRRSDVLIDDVRLREIALGVVKLKRIHSRATIVADGEPAAAIVLPWDTAYVRGAQALCEHVLETSEVELPVVIDEDPGAYPTLIAIGNVSNNRIIESLYWNYHTVVDAVHPGRDGYVVQTVFDPCPLRNGVSVIVLGGSTPQGAEKAARRLVKLMKPGDDLSVGFLNLVWPRRNLDASARSRLKRCISRPAFSEVAWAVDRYARTGDEQYARAAQKAFLALARTFGSPKAPKLSRYQIASAARLFTAWDAIEESPLFRNPARLRVTKALHRILRGMPPDPQHLNRLRTGRALPDAETCARLTGLYFGARYFRRYYGDVDECMDYYLDDVRDALRAMAKFGRSWEDSGPGENSVTLAVRAYALAAGDHSCFFDGNVRRLAGLSLACCENPRLDPGFRASGASRRRLTPVLMYPYWFSRDGRYKWWGERVRRRELPDPYALHVEPVEPVDVAGARRFSVSRALFQYHRGSVTDKRGPEQGGVAYSRSFDKISFRSDLDPLGDYLLLNGLAGGRPSRHNANAILRYCDGGFVLLCGAEGTTSTSTDHNMISVARNGRCLRLMPPLCRLETLSDLPSIGYSHTTVPNHNGSDWHRHTLWVKKQYVAVFDEVRANHAGRYTVDCVWNVLDQGKERVTEDGTLLAEREAQPPLRVVEDDEARDGKAVLLDGAAAQLVFAPVLEPGKYVMEVIARGRTTRADSLWLEMDRKRVGALHVPIGRYGVGSGSADKHGPGLRFDVAAKKSHTFRLWLRGGPGVTVDYIVIRKKGVDADAWHVEAECLMRADRQEPRHLAFRIVNSDGLRPKLVPHAPPPYRPPTKRLIQRQRAKMAQGGSVWFHNFFYARKSEAAPLWRVRALARGVCRADSGSRVEVFGVSVGDRPIRLSPGLVGNCNALYAGPNRVAMIAGTRLTFAGYEIRSDRPISIDLDFSSGRGVVVTRQATDLHVETPCRHERVWLDRTPIAPGRESTSVSLRLSPGRRTFAIDPWDEPTESRASRLAVLRMTEGEGIHRTFARTSVPLPEDAAGLKPAWSLDVPASGRGKALVPLCEGQVLRSKKGECFVAGIGNSVVCLTPLGKKRWRHEMGSAVGSVAVGDLNGDGSPEVVVATSDGRVDVLGSDGRRFWKKPFAERSPTKGATSAAPLLAVGRLRGGKERQIVVTVKRSRLAVLDPRGRLIATLKTGGKRITGLTIADLDRDRRNEILAADRAGSVFALAPDGTVVFRSYSAKGNVTFAVADVDRDGKAVILNGSSAGILRATEFRGRPRWEFKNYGYAFTAILPVAGRGPREGRRPQEGRVCIGSGTGYVHMLNGSGKVVWERELDGVPTCLAVADLTGDGQTETVVGADEGGVCVFGESGKPLSTFQTSGPVDAVTVWPVRGQKRPLIIACVRGVGLQALVFGP